jgi:hypothetical protein
MAEAAIELSAPLWLGPEFLGLLKPARIGDVDLHVVLPDFKGDAGGRTILARHGEQRLDPREFERHFGSLPTDEG